MNVKPLRLTFRDRISPDEPCYQRQLRDGYTTPAPVDSVPLSSARIRPVTLKLARQIILQYEWLGTMAAGTNRAYGIFWGIHCAGVSTFCPAGWNVPVYRKTFGLEDDEIAYLGRGACAHWAPPGCNSKLIAFSLKFERARGSKLGVAFADTDAGEIGTVYQAANWRYIGRGDSWKQWVSDKGKIWSFNGFTAAARKNGMTTGQYATVMRENGWTEQKSNPKHRYVFVIDRNDKRLSCLIDQMSQPYPKRASEA